MLNWENTDQFGNLKVAISSATSLNDVEPDLRDLVRTVLDEHAEGATFSVDIAYSEISAPRGDQVSHVLNLPFISDLVSIGTDKHEIQHNLIEQLKAIVGDDARVQGPWD